MDSILILKKLVNFGISTTLLGKYCNCTGATIRNMINEKYPPKDKLLRGINDGLEQFFNDIKEIIGEE